MVRGQKLNRTSKLCPKCKTEMKAFTSGNRNSIHDWECPKKCEYWEITKAGLRELEPALRDVKEGRTYVVSCAHNKNKGLFVCHECHVKDCRKWYLLGKSDMLKKLNKVKTNGRGKIKRTGTGNNKK